VLALILVAAVAPCHLVGCGERGDGGCDEISLSVIGVPRDDLRYVDVCPRRNWACDCRVTGKRRLVV